MKSRPTSPLAENPTMASEKTRNTSFWIDAIGTEMVRIEVGGSYQKAVFNIHQDILCNKIPFFDKMFNGEFLEGTTKRAEFPEDDVDSFKLLLGWVYNGAIEPHESLEFPFCNTSSIPLLELFILAEKYDITQLVDDCMDYLIKVLREKRLILGTFMWVYTYKHTRRTSKLRLFFTRLAAYALRFRNGEFTSDPTFWTLDDIHSILSQNSDMLMDYLALVQGVSKPQENPLEAPACDYHRHPPSETCPNKAKRNGAVIKTSGKKTSEKQS
ncbi:hypothetical protein NHQ30_004431 [Ciborinia camelliae]|nr:hypothetical protein NHQ30_004431 [Ciborinia camelliae]